MTAPARSDDSPNERAVEIVGGEVLEKAAPSPEHGDA